MEENDINDVSLNFNGFITCALNVPLNSHNCQ